MGARLGWGEIVIILIIALIVLGPDKLPQLGRALGKAVRGVKKYVREAAQELEEFDDLKEIKNDVDGIQKDLRSMGRNIEKSVTDDLASVEAEIDTAAEDIRTSVESEPEGPAAETAQEAEGEDPEAEEKNTAPEADLAKQEES